MSFYNLPPVFPSEFSIVPQEHEHEFSKDKELPNTQGDSCPNRAKPMMISELDIQDDYESSNHMEIPPQVDNEHGRCAYFYEIFPHSIQAKTAPGGELIGQAQVQQRMARPAAAPPWIIHSNINIKPQPAGSPKFLNRTLSISFKDSSLVYELIILCVCQIFIWRPGERLRHRGPHPILKHFKDHSHPLNRQGKFVSDLYDSNDVSFRVGKTDLRSNPFQVGEDDAIVTESSDEEAAIDTLPGARPLDHPTPTTRPLGTENMPSNRPTNTEKIPSVTEGRITRAKAKELAREVKAMLKEEAPRGTATQDVYNLFQATKEGEFCPTSPTSPQPSLPSLTIHSPRSIHPTRFLHSHPHLTIKTDSSPPVLKRHHPSLPPLITIPPPPALYLTIRTASHHPQSAAPSSISSRVKIAREDRIT
ncbi:unnamed protein product [Cochlearia groenlandica]